MVTVTGDLSNILGVRGDGVVRISAREPYPVSGVVVIDDWDDVPVKAGKFTVTMQPGAARFHVIVGSTSHIFEVNVPESGTFTLADLIVNEYPYTPQVVSQVVQSAKDAAASASAAKTSENQALVYRNAASSSASAAASSASAAKTSETNAKTSETNAKASESSALSAKNAASSSASAAASSASAAKTSETNATNSANAAKTSENNAKTSENNAKTSASQAAASAATAGQAAGLVQGDRMKITDDRYEPGYPFTPAYLWKNYPRSTRLGFVVGADVGLPVQYAVVESVVQWVDRSGGDITQIAFWGQDQWIRSSAGETTWGPWKPAGGGSWNDITDKPTTFPPAAHKHTLADITDAPNSHTSARTGGTLVSRDSGGRAQFSDPAAAQDAATKAYVDSRTPKIQVVSAMPSSPDPSIVYVVV